MPPDIVRALVDGRQPIQLTPTRLFRLSKYLPHEWSEQPMPAIKPAATSMVRPILVRGRPRSYRGPAKPVGVAQPYATLTAGALNCGNVPVK